MFKKLSVKKVEGSVADEEKDEKFNPGESQ